MFSTLISATFVGLSVAGYTLQDDYMDGDFFGKWYVWVVDNTQKLS